MLFFAHRGYIENGDGENTLEAFERAIEKKMPIELDVRITKDRVPIVFHDANLKRLTGIAKKVSDAYYSEIKEIRLNTGEKIPTLKETLEFVNNRTLLLIEFKTAKKGFVSHRLVKKSAKLLENYSGEYMLQAFNYFTVKYCKRKFKDIKVGRLSSRCYGSRYCGDFINYNLFHLNAEKVRDFRKKGIGVYGWAGFCGDRAKIIQKASELELDGIIL